MDGAQFLRRTHVGLALIAHDLVGHAELFEQPQHALGARIVEMMNRQHRRPPQNLSGVPVSGLRGISDRSALAQRTKAPRRCDIEMITRVILTAKLYPGIN